MRQGKKSLKVDIKKAITLKKGQSIDLTTEFNFMPLKTFKLIQNQQEEQL